MDIRMRCFAAVLGTVMGTALLCHPPGSVHARPNVAPCGFKNYSLAEGLSQGNVYTVTQDHYGFLWIGTQDGLNRFDGYEFVVYNRNPFDSTSLSNNKVNCLAVDDAGGLWIGTDQGLNRRDYLREGFVRFIHDPADPTSLSDGEIRCLLFDDGGRLWIGGTFGLDRLDRGADGFVHMNFRAPSDAPSPRGVNDLLEDSHGRIWICTGDGIYLHEKGSTGFSRFRPYDGHGQREYANNVRCIEEIEDDRFLVGTGEGFFRFDPDSNHFVRMPLYRNSGEAEEYLYVTDILRDSHGMTWVTTINFGLFVFPAGDERSTRYVHDISDPRSLAHSGLNCVFEDRCEIVWVGTAGYGLSAWSPYAEKFRLYSPGGVGAAGVQIRSIRAIYEDSHGTIWIGGYGGLERLGTGSNTFEHFGEMPSGTVYVIAPDPSAPDSILWLGTEGEGLARFDIPTRCCISYPVAGPGRDGLLDKNVYSMCWDGAGGLLIGTGAGLCRFDFAGERFDSVESFGENTKVRALLLDHRGNLWAGLDRGVAMRRAGEESFIKYHFDPANPRGLSNSLVLCLHEDSRGTMWIGTAGGGMNALDPMTGNFRHYMVQQGLPNNVVYGILEDGAGMLWVSTNAGIARFDPAAETFRCFGIDDGLQSKEFNASAYHKGSSGTLYFGGINGFNAISPDDISGDPHAPPVVLTGVLVNGVALGADGTIGDRRLLVAPLVEAERIELSYHDAIVTFEFAALNLSSPRRNTYAYRLTDPKGEWHEIGNTRRVTFTSLAPGRHHLSVKAANPDGVWNEKGFSTTIFVVPPFWQTAWFKGAMICAVALLLLAVYRLRTAYILKRNTELDRINKKLAEEVQHGRRVERALRESERKYWNILENIEIGAALLDTDIRIVELNRKMRELFPGIEPGDMPFCFSAGGEERGNDNAPPHPAVMTLTDGMVHEAFHTIRRGDGTVTYRIVASPVIDENGKISAAIELVEDVTRQEKMEERIRRSQKMEAIGNLAGGIAHDFNNLLFALLGNAQLAKRDLSPSDAAFESIEQIEMAGQRAADLVKQILTVSKHSKPAKKVMQAAEPVKEVVKLLRGSLPATVEIRSDIAEGLRPVYADPAQIHQVLMNLGTNAYQAMSDQSGVLEIKLDEVEVSAEGKAGTWDLAEGTYVRLLVRDNGSGMDKQTMERIFEPYFTTKKNEKGVGFGLSIVHGIVKGMGGDIEVHSEPGKGSSFYVYFPIAEGEITQEKKIQEIPKKIKGTGHVLVVDDEEAISALIEKSLVKTGYSVSAYTDSEKALDTFTAEPRTFDLVISDVTMPGLTGIELAKRIRGIRADIPIILCTGYSDKLDPEWARSFGIDRCLSKPISIELLAGILSEILSRSRTPHGSYRR